MSHPPLHLPPDLIGKLPVVESHFPGGVPQRLRLELDGAICIADSISIVTVSNMQSTAAVTQDDWRGCYIPSAVDVFETAAGAVFVLDTNCAAVYKYNSMADVGTNTAAATWGSLGTGNGQFAQPQKVVVDAADNIYVADSANNRIVQIDAAGAWRYCTGYGSDHFNNPCGIALDGVGHLYVADTGHSRIVRIRNIASFMQTPTAGDWQPYTGYQALQYPFSISLKPGAATDDQPFSTYVVDWANFQSFNASFPQRGTGPRLVELYGTAAGPEPGSTAPSFQANTVLHNPIAVWMGRSGIYVTDQATRSVAHFTSITDQQPTHQNAQAKLSSPVGLCVSMRWVPV